MTFVPQTLFFLVPAFSIFCVPRSLLLIPINILAILLAVSALVSLGTHAQPILAALLSALVGASVIHVLPFPSRLVLIALSIILSGATVSSLISPFIESIVIPILTVVFTASALPLLFLALFSPRTHPDLLPLPSPASAAFENDKLHIPDPLPARHLRFLLPLIQLCTTLSAALALAHLRIPPPIFSLLATLFTVVALRIAHTAQPAPPTQPHLTPAPIRIPVRLRLASHPRRAPISPLPYISDFTNLSDPFAAPPPNSSAPPPGSTHESARATPRPSSSPRPRILRMSAWGRLTLPLPPQKRPQRRTRSLTRMLRNKPSTESGHGLVRVDEEKAEEVGVNLEEALLAQRLLRRLQREGTW
ncbi:hypothetical protein BD779DRAFT_1669719 [Infundibulicybe gibba]|nr:hypothetical protein BD779DRAFT_1669719 [Infundibulicybe gibba]